MKRILLYGHMLLILAGSSCKTSQSRSAKISEAASTHKKLFNLTLSSTKETHTYEMSTNPSYSLKSPISFLSVDQFNELKQGGAYIVDFSSQGSLFNVSNSTKPPSACFQVGIFSIFTSSNQTKFFLVSSFSNSSAKGLQKSVQLGDFQYCQNEKNNYLTFKNQKTLSVWNQYSQQRGITFAASQALALGSEAVVTVIEKKGKKEIKEEISAPMTPERKKIPLKTNPIIPERRFAPGSANRSFLQLRQRTLQEQIEGNSKDKETYEALKIEDLLTADTYVGEGTFAHVYKVPIDGKYYAVRVESREHLSEDEFRNKVAKERMNFIVQNQFAKQDPNAGFVETHLSYFTEDEFVTISDFKEGGELFDRITDEFPNPHAASLETLAGQLDKQFRLYQKGVEIEYKNEKYTLSFFHGDIKPENIVLDKERQTAGFIDFGLSRIILIGKDGNYYEMKGKPDDKADLGLLEISTKKEENGIVRGSAAYTSPEILHAREDLNYTKTNQEAYRILKNIDTYAFNMTVFICAKQNFPSHYIEGDVEELFQATLKAVTLRTEEDRIVRTFSDFDGSDFSEGSRLLEISCMCEDISCKA